MIKKLAVAGTAVLALTLSACGGGDTGGASGEGATGGTLTLAISQNMESWDLAEAGLGHSEQYYQPVFDPLLKLDQQGEVKENLATSWTYDPAMTTLTLKLRTDVKFSDGSALDSTAVKTSLLHAKAGTGESAAKLKSIDDVQAPDPSTAVVKLTAPDPGLLRNFANVPGMIASPTALTAASGPVGSGPYKLDASASTAGTEYVFVGNPDYWNKKDFPFDTIVMKTLDDPTAETNALLAGQVDGASITPDRIPALEGGGLDITKFYSGIVEGLYIWDRAGKITPALADVRVRQALNYAFDTKAIVKVAKKGLGETTTQHFAPDSEAFSVDLDKKYGYDPAKAKALLAEAGYAGGFDVVMPDISTLFPEAQAAMVEQLGAVGVRVQLDKIPFSQFMPSLLQGKYALSYFKTGSTDPWNVIQLLVREKATWNPLGYKDDHALDLVNRISLATGEEQDKLYKELNEYMVDQAWDAPWNFVQDVYASSKRVQVTTQPYSMLPPIYNFKPAS